MVVERPIAKGANDVTWTVAIDDPALWWPWSLGDQPLYDVTVAVSVDGIESHARTVRTGLRQVALRKWVLSVNGERLFTKGANLAPTRQALGDATPGELRRDVELARDAGLDLVRMHAHISRPELYDAADELGMLVWQDFPLQWGYARSVRKQAVRQVRKAADLLAHHPSIALWCGHNEPITLDVAPGHAPDTRSDTARFIAGHELPITWNRTVLDNSVKRAFEKADDSRPVVAHSGIAPHLPQLEGTDSHLYFGWYHGETEDLAGFAAAWPRMVRFVSEFGAQAVPEDAAFMNPACWPDLDWEHLGRRHALQKAVFDRRVPPAEFSTFAEWKHATQRYQADVIKQQIETLRRLKYHPTGGFAMFVLNDATPAVSWSVLGHDRTAKEGYTALADACRPVIITADQPPRSTEPGRRLELAVHVVNDLRRPLDGAVATARVHWRGGERSWRWQGDVAADSVAKVGQIELDVPEAHGPLVIDLDVIAEETTATNRYAVTITT
jgi:beta-mannosidase